MVRIGNPVSLYRACPVTNQEKTGNCILMTTPEQLNNFTRRVPDGDNMVRDVCDTCGSVWLDATELDRLEHPRERPLSAIDRLLRLLKRA